MDKVTQFSSIYTSVSMMETGVYVTCNLQESRKINTVLRVAN